MNAPLRGAEPDRQRYRGWIIEWQPDGQFWAFWDEIAGIGGGAYTAAEARQLVDRWAHPSEFEPSEDDLEGPDEGPAVIYSAEEEMAFIAEAERREMYAREEYEEDE